MHPAERGESSGLGSRQEGSAALSNGGSLPRATLQVGLVVLATFALPVASTLFDVAWHMTLDKQARFLGLPHPWTVQHFGIVVGMPMWAWLLAGLIRRDGGRRDRDGGLTMLTVLGRRGPAGAMVTLAAMALAVLAVAFDSANHLTLTKSEPTFSPPHLTLMFAGIMLHLGLVVLMYDLAMGPALAEQVDQRRLARLGLWLSLVWLTAALVYVFPFNPRTYNASTDAAIIAFTVSGAVAAAIRLWPWPFPVLTILAPYLLFRAAAYGLMMSNGWTGAPVPLEPLFIVATAVDLWLLLPFNRGRGLAQVAFTGALLGLVWAPLGYSYWLPIAGVERNSLQNALLQSIPAGLLGACLGLLFSWIVDRLTHLESAVPGSRALSQPFAPSRAEAVLPSTPGTALSHFTSPVERVGVMAAKAIDEAEAPTSEGGA